MIPGRFIHKIDGESGSANLQLAVHKFAENLAILVLHVDKFNAAAFRPDVANYRRKIDFAEGRRPQTRLMVLTRAIPVEESSMCARKGESSGTRM